jgi:hypothetical protein
MLGDPAPGQRIDVDHGHPAARERHGQPGRPRIEPELVGNTRVGAQARADLTGCHVEEQELFRLGDRCQDVGQRAEGHVLDLGGGN